MDLRNCVWGVLALWAWFPIGLAAQFQEPTANELRMTSDPKAPGASAVYLYREEEVDDEKGFMSYYQRIKVLTDKGREMATVHIPYDPDQVTIQEIQGRTIHPDGKVVAMTESVSDLLSVKGKSSQENAIVFSLPSVEVGSILEFRTRIKYKRNLVSSPTWWVQGPLFVHQAHYSFRPGGEWGHKIVSGNEVLGHLLWVEHLGPEMHASCDKKNACSLDVKDVPPAPKEDWMPPQNTTTWRVQFYYSSYGSAAEFWKVAAQNWTDWVQDFTKPTNPLKDAVAALVQPDDSDAVKARKIYAAVMKLDNTSFSRAKSESERKREKLKDIRKAEDVWKQQSGNANEIALLYIAMARAAGLQAWPMEVVDRSRALLDNLYLSSWQLDDYLAVVSIDGQKIYLDPGQKMCPFGMLHWKHTLAGGFLLTEHGTFVATTPDASYKSASTERIADLTVRPDGSIEGTIRYVFVGPAALNWRQIAILNDVEEVKKLFNEAMIAALPEGVHATFDHFVGLDDPTSKLVGILTVSGDLGVSTGKRLMLPGLFFEAHAKHPFVSQDRRITPIDVQYARLEQDDVTYHLPSGYEVEIAPQATNLTWQRHAALRIEPKVNANVIEVVRTMAYNFAVLPATDYGDLRDFFQKIETADQQQLVLTRSAEAKGL